MLTGSNDVNLPCTSPQAPESFKKRYSYLHHWGKLKKPAIEAHSVPSPDSQQAKWLREKKKKNRNLLFIDQLLIDGEIVGIYCAFWSIP